MKLAAELGRRSNVGHTLYVLDEPTTGLHFVDVERLLNVLQRLADTDASLIVIEHNLTSFAVRTGSSTLVLRADPVAAPLWVKGCPKKWRK